MTFKYTNSLGRKYGRDKYIKYIIFNISRYGEHQRTLYVEGLTESQIVKKIEKFLNQPITAEYFNEVKNDLFHDDMLFEELSTRGYEVVGDLLTDAKFLEGFDNIVDGTYKISTGS